MEINHKFNALDKNHTWMLTTPPKSKKAFTFKWVYRTKYKLDGIVGWQKARFDIRGFEQVEEKYYKHTFSSATKPNTVRIFIVLATANRWPLHQLDTNDAFLHGYIDE